MTSIDWLLGGLAFLTSSLTAVLGIGGGLILIAFMPLMLPGQAVIPLHAVTQLSSNGSRALFALRDVHWPLAWPFLAGSLVGVAIFGLFVSAISGDAIPVFIGCYILLSLWSQAFNRFVQRYENFFNAGLFQSGLGVIVGATGPLTTTLLIKRQLNKDQVVATNALFMVVTHLLKILVFGLVGFVYADYLWVMLAMVAGAIAGSWFGSKMRRKVPEKAFNIMLKWLLTLLAIKMLVEFSLQHWPLY